jgi:hypothetical protein
MIRKATGIQQRKLPKMPTIVTKSLAALALMVLALFSYMLYLAYVPVSVDRQPLPPPLIAIDQPEGQTRLQRSLATDFWQIKPFFQSQHFATTCGIASSVSIINAAQQKQDLSQDVFLDQRIGRSKAPFLARTLGLSLTDLKSALSMDTQSTEIHLASAETADGFRTDVLKALDDPHMMIIVNYSRKTVHQAGSGHLSPIGAYDSASDSVLVMDVASHKYPFTWVPLNLLFDAMNTTPAQEAVTRGWIDVVI